MGMRIFWGILLLAACVGGFYMVQHHLQEKQLADDTAKLLTLANELKKEMDKSSKDTLSLTVIKKAEEVEKLAHKVRDEMKESLVN